MPPKLKLLIADDDPVFLRLLPTQLSGKPLEISTTSSGESVIKTLSKQNYDVVILDLGLPDMSGLEVLEKVREDEARPEVIVLTGDSTLESGLEAMRLGAYDYLTKPADPEHIYHLIEKAAEKSQVVKENKRLKIVASQTNASLVEPIYRSDVMETLFSEASRIAGLDSTILITGESGTGKDVLANWIHSKSARASMPMVSINCGAIPENLVESEFFGFEKGAFTGAGKEKVGLIEAADGSTLFLDEIGEMPLSLQAKLLRFLETGEFRKVGSVRTQYSNVRLIAATNKNLRTEASKGTFREDLYYRLNVISFDMPPLRSRGNDANDLADHFLESFRSKYGRDGLRFSDAARIQIRDYFWPGNVRELKNAIERTVALAEDESISQIYGLSTVPLSTPQESITGMSAELQTIAELEKAHIERVLDSVDGNREKAAQILGITARTLYRKLKLYKSA